MEKPVSNKTNTIDDDEVAKFSAMAETWWDPHGQMRPLHKLNPVRLSYIRSQSCAILGLDEASATPLAGLHLLDIGCGGGLLSEPMARLGAHVLGADASDANIKTAQLHAEQNHLKIDYRTTTAETLAANGNNGKPAQFDIILNMEVIEHVANPAEFVRACAAMLKPDGIMFLATLNRTAKAFALAIIGAEYVLGWLPRGTHDWHKFITPDELEKMTRHAELELIRSTGVSFNPFSDQWRTSGDMSVNYMAIAQNTIS